VVAIEGGEARPLDRAAQELPLGVLVADDAERGLAVHHGLGGERPRAAP